MRRQWNDRQAPRIGIDIGRVIMNAPPEDLMLDEAKFLSAPAVPLAFRTIVQLSRRWFAGGARIWLVSKCRRLQARQNVRMWLERRSFFEQTSIPRDHLEFCDQNREKGPIAEHLKLLIFLDDSLEVLLAMPLVKHRILFRPDPAEVRRFGCIPPEIRVIERTWRENGLVIGEIMADAREGHSGSRRRKER